MSARVEKRETSQEELQRVITDPKLIRWFVVRLDETKYWDQSSLAELLQKECGRSVLPDKIYSTYLVSPDIGVHICSFQASVEAWFLESFPWWEESVDGVAGCLSVVGVGWDWGWTSRGSRVRTGTMLSIGMSKIEAAKRVKRQV